MNRSCADALRLIVLATLFVTPSILAGCGFGVSPAVTSRTGRESPTMAPHAVNIDPLPPSAAPTKMPADAAAFGGKHYRFYPEQIAWKEAKAKCEELGGRLAIITGAAQNDFLTKLVLDAGKRESWLGATDEVEEGKWVWVDGTRMDYKNWESTQPNNKGGVEHYLVLWAVQQGVWVDQPNVSTQHQPGYLCEWGDAARTAPAAGR